MQRRLFFLARRFVAGETVDTALEAVDALNADGLSASLDFLGEDVHSQAEAAHTTQTYLTMIERIVAARADCNVSVKLSAIGQAISEDLALENLVRIAERAQACGMFVRLDMEGSGSVDSTYRILERASSSYRDIGPVVQAYLRRAPADVERAIDRGWRVRLCKGAYKEPAEVALQPMPEIRDQFLELARALLVRGTYPAIATHDERIISAVQTFARDKEIGQDDFEFQMLYGIRPERQRELRHEGYRVRIYVPFGTHWAAYFYRRMAERKENVFFVVRSIFSR
ncbi:MAG: proline dehydrogenase family protein [Candidatus Eremiobacteraeota bacterium]|nr:proline dehydrogenase family protein [Candidatus Eremiobacteraeota bacterium]